MEGVWRIDIKIFMRHSVGMQVEVVEARTVSRAEREKHK